MASGAADGWDLTEGLVCSLERPYEAPDLTDAEKAAFCVGFGRLGATWNMIEELPDRFRTDDRATPWGGEAITLR
jgi:hypothetical protein